MITTGVWAAQEPFLGWQAVLPNLGPRRSSDGGVPVGRARTNLNPAVTLAFAARGNFPWLLVPGYIVAQQLGAVLAYVFLQGMLGT